MSTTFVLLFSFGLFAFGFGVPFLKKIKRNFLFILPVLNALADVTIYYFPDDSINSGIIRAIILLVFIAVVSWKVRFNSTSILLFVLLFYLFLLVLLSSDITASFLVYVKVLISFMMYPIGFNLITTQEELKKLNVATVFSALVIVINSIVAQIFKLGVSPYLKDAFYLGGGLVEVSYLIVVSLLLAPITYAQLRKKTSKIAATVIYISAFIIMLLIFRRISYLALFVGYFVYFLYSSRKRYILKYVTLAVIALIALFHMVPYINVTFNSLLDKRLHTRKFEDEGRVIYTKKVIDEFLNKPLKHKMFGTELFNSFNYFHANRGLHTDYNVIFHGAGLVGLLFYLSIFAKIIADFNRNKQYLHVDALKNELRAVFFVLILCSFIISFSGSLTSISYRSILFLYFGGVLRIATEQKKRLVAQVLGDGRPSPADEPETVRIVETI